MTFAESLQRHKYFLLLIIPLIGALYGKIVPDMVMEWYRDDNYSHGFLVPFIAGYFVYQHLSVLKAAKVEPSNLGLVVVLAALGLLVFASLSVEYFTLRASLILLFAGMILWFFGRPVFRTLRFPLGYLLFMIPLPYIVYDSIAFPLKLFVTTLSVKILKVLGIAVIQEGNILMFAATTLEVADACSGIRTLMSLAAISTALAFYLDISPVKRGFLIASAVPVAVTTNFLRVIITGILAQWWGKSAAEGFFHQFAGMALFILGIVLTGMIGGALQRKKA